MQRVNTHKRSYESHHDKHKNAREKDEALLFAFRDGELSLDKLLHPYYTRYHSMARVFKQIKSHEPLTKTQEYLLIQKAASCIVGAAKRLILEEDSYMIDNAREPRYEQVTVQMCINKQNECKIALRRLIDMKMQNYIKTGSPMPSIKSLLDELSQDMNAFDKELATKQIEETPIETSSESVDCQQKRQWGDVE